MFKLINLVEPQQLELIHELLAISAHDNPPPIHPRDKALLRPLASLGKPTGSAHGISFLRRTEYITAGAAGASRIEEGKRRVQKRRRQQDSNKDDPIFIMRSIMKGFDVAYPHDAYSGPDKPDMLRSADVLSEEKQAWLYPRHPTKPEVKLLDSYPILPDVDGLPTSQGYSVVRFGAPPLPYAPADKYEERLDTGILRVFNTPTVQAKYETRKATDPSFRGVPEFDYEYFLPSATSVQGIKRKFSIVDPNRDSEELYDTHDSEAPCFRFDKLRFYETTQQSGEAGEDVDRFDDSIAIALHDGESDDPASRPLQKGAYIYPIMGRISLKPKRGLHRINQRYQMEEEPLQPPVDVLEVTAREPDEDELQVRQAIKERLFEVSVPTVEA